MAKVRVRPETGNLYLDFSYRGKRCREQTALQDTPSNRRTLLPLASKIQRAIAAGAFDYRSFFPDSPRAAQFESRLPGSTDSTRLGGMEPTPTVREFAETWYEENKPRWRASHADTVRGALDLHILPALKSRPLSELTRADLLAFRANLSKRTKKNGDPLSASRINHIMTPLRMLLAEAAERHGFATPFRNIKPLRTPRIDIQPFSLEEVRQILGAARKDWNPYLTVRFFTGMRTGEINGLEWKHIDFDQDLIRVRQSLVKDQVQDTKTEGSIRDIPMVPLVRSALLEQRKLVPDGCRWVFAQRNGAPINLVNFTNRVWHPLLRHLGLETRRPYQTRHTAATLMLGSGENPEWVARMLGHVNTEMLFRVYSRYVPNLTRNDGRAFTGLVSASEASVVENNPAGKQDPLPASLAMLSRQQLEALVRSFSQQPGEESHNEA